MRSLRAILAVVGVAGTLTAQGALGQLYQPYPSVLRYPQPQLPVQTQPAQPTVSYPPMAGAVPSYTANGPNATPPYGAVATTPYASPVAVAPPQYYPQTYPVTPQSYGYNTVTPQYTGQPSYVQTATGPRIMGAAMGRSVMVQNPTPAEPIAAPPAQMQQSPSDIPVPPVPQNGNYSYPDMSSSPYYPDVKSPQPQGYSPNPYAAHNGSYAPMYSPSQFAAPGSAATCSPYGAWSATPAFGSVASDCYGAPAVGPPAYGYPPVGYPNPCADPCNPPVTCAPPVWFGGIYAIYMSRDNENHCMFSYDDGWESIQLTDSRDSNPDIMCGFETRFGRYFNCGLNAVQAVYWGVAPEEGSTSTSSSAVIGNLNGIWNWDDLNYNGTTSEWWVNDAVVHAIWRENEFHNVEVNFLQFGNVPGCGTSCCGVGSSCDPCNKCDPCGSACGWERFRYGWLAGIRWFHFRDELLFGADTVNSVFTYAPEEIYYHVQTVNNLVGFQLGGMGQYYLTPRFSIDFGHKVGVFGNHSEHDSSIGGAAGVAVINNGPNAGRAFAISSSKDACSFLGEVNVGLSYRFTPRWMASAGYRAIGATGIALPTNQIYPDLRGINDLEDVDSNGSVIVHGGYLGAVYNF